MHYVVRTFVKGEEDNELVKRFIIYNFEEHIRNYPGQKIVILFDMTETGLKNLVSYFHWKFTFPNEFFMRRIMISLNLLSIVYYIIIQEYFVCSICSFLINHVWKSFFSTHAYL